MPDWERQSLRENWQCPDFEIRLPGGEHKVCFQLRDGEFLTAGLQVVPENTQGRRHTNEAHGRRPLKRLASDDCGRPDLFFAGPIWNR